MFIMSVPIVEFLNVSFRYNENSPWALKNCSFKIYQNEWVAIIGHNGSGKSTIAKLMTGLLFPNEGEDYIKGEKLTPETVCEIRHYIDMVCQNPDNEFDGATILDEIAFGM